VQMSSASKNGVLHTIVPIAQISPTKLDII